MKPAFKKQSSEQFNYDIEISDMKGGPLKKSENI